jgi:hypothetical protein
MQLQHCLSRQHVMQRAASRRPACRVNAVSAPVADQAQQQTTSVKSLRFVKYQGLGNDFILVRAHYLCISHAAFSSH